MPLVCLALVMAGLSFAGVPPFGGFIGKYLVFTAAIEANLSWLAVIGVLTSVLQTAYIFRLIYVMYGKKSKDETRDKRIKTDTYPHLHPSWLTDNLRLVPKHRAEPNPPRCTPTPNNYTNASSV